MTDQITLNVRAMQNGEKDIVVDAPKFLLINMNTVDNGKVTSIVTISFKGEQIPSDDDLTHDLMIVGDWSKHPRYGWQFSVSAWAVIDDAPAPVVRHKARRLSQAELKRLMSKQ